MTRSFNITNSKKRDAEVGLEAAAGRTRVQYLLDDGTPHKTTYILKSTINVTDSALLAKYNGDARALGEAIIEADPEIDFENIGRIVNRTRKIYLDKDNRLVYRVNLFQLRKNPQGEEIERKDLIKSTANITGENIVQWTGRKMPKTEAIKKFVFSRKYQIKHISGLTFDFLYDMAKDLQETDSLMLVGGGKKGTDPLILTSGGDPYRGFLEGRIDGDKYCLILHLTNMELKGVAVETL